MPYFQSATPHLTKHIRNGDGVGERNRSGKQVVGGWGLYSSSMGVGLSLRWGLASKGMGNGNLAAKALSDDHYFPTFHW